MANFELNVAPEVIVLTDSDDEGSIEVTEEFRPLMGGLFFFERVELFWW